ncbi:hypothetical protein MYX82_14710, partial [Acidobacteria bacterium AH-259-D05]|nr:hypothetical protein [Acidobacteria bacterium AH-259-D05]
EDRPATPTAERGRGRKELRRLRGEIIAERSKRLKPLHRRIEEVEKTIVAREEEVQRVDVLLCDAATEGEAESIATLVRCSSALKAEIQSLFDELEKLTPEHDWLQREFERRLAELE